MVLELGIIGRRLLEETPEDSGHAGDATSKDMEETVDLEEVKNVITLKLPAVMFICLSGFYMMDQPKTVHIILCTCI